MQGSPGSLIPITSHDLSASLAQTYVPVELEREGLILIYRILANPFISGLVEKKHLIKGTRQRRAASSPLVNDFLVYLTKRSFGIVGIQLIQFLIYAKRMLRFALLHCKTAEFRFRSSHLCLGGLATVMRASFMPVGLTVIHLLSKVSG